MALQGHIVDVTTLALWRMDGSNPAQIDANAVAGSAVPGLVPSPSNPSYVAGKIGNARSLAANDYLAATGTDSLFGAPTWEKWVYVPALTGSPPASIRIFESLGNAIVNGGTLISAGLYLNSTTRGLIGGYTYGGDGYATNSVDSGVWSGYTLPVDTWVHVALVVDAVAGATTVSIYAAGQLVAESTPFFDAPDSLSAVNATFVRVGGVPSFSMLSDELCVRSDLRSAAQIAADATGNPTVILPTPVGAVNGGTGTLRDLYTDPITGELALLRGDLVVARGSVAVLQSVRQRLRFFLAEWAFDETVGVPWLQRILVKNPKLDDVRALLRDVIERTPGIVTVNSITADFNKATRSLSVSWSASSDLGELLSDTLKVDG